MYTFYLSVNYTSIELGGGSEKEEFYLERNGEEEEKMSILSTESAAISL